MLATTISSPRQVMRLLLLNSARGSLLDGSSVARCIYRIAIVDHIHERGRATVPRNAADLREYSLRRGGGPIIRNADTKHARQFAVFLGHGVEHTEE